MAVQDDVQEARRAVAALQRSTRSVIRQLGSSVDAARLEADVSRLTEDLDLLCGKAPVAPLPLPGPAPALPRRVIVESDPIQDFWMDAEDEGLGGSSSRRSW